MKLKCIGSGILITLSFVFVVGMISSIAMIAFKESAEHAALISGMAQAVYLFFTVLILKIKKINIKDTYGLRLVSYKEYFLPVLAAFCFSAFSNILQAAAPIPPELIGGMSDDVEKSAAAFILAVFIIAPAVEEFVFRALIITKLRKGFTVTVSVFVSAILFALIHIMAGGIVTVIHAFLGGIIFSLAYVKTKSLFPAAAAHLFGNIGGYVPAVTNNLPVILQYIAATVFLAASIMFSVMLIRKKDS